MLKYPFYTEGHMPIQIQTRETQSGTQPIPGIKNIIAVASGKGGVGKSTVAANLALALASLGARVGMLDADIYGPSQPTMLGMTGVHPETLENKKMKPIIANGIQTMSIGYLVDGDAAMIWRGPMVSGALQQMLKDTAWDNLDYLIVDLPPGTGDIQLTMAQKIPVTAALIVTTPQDIALLDARKAYHMFRKVKIDVIGMIENMSTHLCSQCGHQEAIFGEGGGSRMARQYDLPLLAQLPLDIKIREQADAGKIIVSDVFVELAQSVHEKIQAKKQSFASKFPPIVVL
jgi:ATP-binding protein involved in chromosome partitioning